MDFDKKYPHISQWVISQAYVEIGHDYGSSSFIRALDEGGLVWEGKTVYATLEEALHDLEEGLQEWME